MLYRLFEFTATFSIVLVHVAMLIRLNELTESIASLHREALNKESDLEKKEFVPNLQVPTVRDLSTFPLPPPPPPASFEFRSVPVSSNKTHEQTAETTRPGGEERRPPMRRPNAYWQEKAKQRIAQIKREQAQDATIQDPELTLPKRPQLPAGG
jgi:hypothetical protein